ncbi:MAG: stage II sporulation protein D [Paenibacillaceae bacterium]
MKSRLRLGEFKAVVQRGVQNLVRHPMIVIVSAWMMIFLFAVTMIPLLVVKHQPQTVQEMRQTQGSGVRSDVENLLKVAVYLTDEKRVEEVPLEQYIRGVLAAEMPIEFELEALKAQAIAARTYIIKRYVDKDFSNVPVAGALVTDSVSHQAYLTDEKIEKKWSKSPDREANLKKLNRAVEETKGLVITYSGQPILATFFSTSNGFTENSEDYWTLKLPYLRSVESTGEDKLSPKFKTTQTYSIDEVANKLEVDAIPVTGNLPMKVIERSDGHRIMRIQVGDKILSGREVRERLGLASTQFTWRSIGDVIEFTIYGSGHGVGMSQWGAEEMAMEGKEAQEILTHYYKGVSIEKIHSLESIL